MSIHPGANFVPLIRAHSWSVEKYSVNVLVAQIVELRRLLVINWSVTVHLAYWKFKAFFEALCISVVRKLRVTLNWRMAFWQSQLMGPHSLAKPRLRWHFAVQSVVCSQIVNFQGLRLLCMLSLSNTSANLWATSHCKQTRVVKCRNTWKNAHHFLWQACKMLCPWVLFRETTVYIYSLRLHCSRYVCNH